MKHTYIYIHMREIMSDIFGEPTYFYVSVGIRQAVINEITLIVSI